MPIERSFQYRHFGDEPFDGCHAVSRAFALGRGDQEIYEYDVFLRNQGKT